MKQVRETKKSRTVRDLSDALVDLVNNQGLYDPSKADIIKSVADQSMAPGASMAMRSLLEQEAANMLEAYWSEVCLQASEELLLPYHFTSRSYFKRGKPVPQSVEEARQFVVVFGNGSTGKSAGVRFVTKEDEPDPMLLIHLQKRIDVVQKSIETHQHRISTALDSEAVGLADRQRLTNNAPLPITHA